MTKIEELANMLGEELKNSEQYKRYKQAQKVCTDDAGLSEKVREFHVQRALLEQNAENDKTLAESINARIEALYAEISANEKMKEFDKAEDEMNLLLNTINMTITSYINEEEVTNESHSCGGNCAACRGCH